MLRSSLFLSRIIALMEAVGKSDDNILLVSY